MRDDIIGIMKNAMSRGANPQQVARSLINSGYNSTEVNEALSYITGGALASLNPKTVPVAEKITTLSSQKPKVKALPAPNHNKLYTPKRESRGGGIKTVLLFTFLFILIGVLVATIFYKEEILSFISP
jgi:hypothetical protein